MTNERHILHRILETAKLRHDACAAALGLSRPIFEEMLAGQRDIPESMIPLIAAVVGVPESVLTSSARLTRGTDVVPAIWYKLRADGINDADREYVLALRQIAFYQHELELATESRAGAWKAIFEDVRRQTDPQASPTEQGRLAARLFRTSTGLDQGATGIGEVLRGCLRNMGILVIESSAPEAGLEGCSFYVGPSGSERPCVFANSYGTTWFRRNRILMHEVAHSIFDVESAIAVWDFKDANADTNLPEIRADAFAQEALVPKEVLRNVAQRHGVGIQSINVETLATLVAATHVEQRLLAKALFDTDLIDQDTRTSLELHDIAKELRRQSSHALTTKEFVQSEVGHEAMVKGRTTTTGPRQILLAPRYVQSVLAAFKALLISRGKAARMLMIDEYEFAERFAPEQPLYAD